MRPQTRKFSWKMQLPAWMDGWSWRGTVFRIPHYPHQGSTPVQNICDVCVDLDSNPELLP